MGVASRMNAALAACVLSGLAVVVVSFRMTPSVATFNRAAMPPTRWKPRPAQSDMLLTQQSRSTAALSTASNNNNNNNNNSGDDDDDKLDLLETLTNILALPTPFAPDLSLGYPVALLVATAIFFPDPLSAIFPSLFFTVFRLLGNNALLLVEEDGDGNEEDVGATDSPYSLSVDFAAFVAAFLSSFLIDPVQSASISTSSTGPETTTIGTSYSGIITATILLLATGATGSILASRWSFPRKKEGEDKVDQPMQVERSRMDLWDDQFNKRNER